MILGEIDLMGVEKVKLGVYHVYILKCTSAFYDKPQTTFLHEFQSFLFCH